MTIRKFMLFLLAMGLTLFFMREGLAKTENDYYSACMANFNLEQMDFHSPDAAPFTPLLYDYFACRAVTRDDINECSNLLEPNECKRQLTTDWLFYGKLATTGKVTKPILDACTSKAATPQEKQGCKALAEAIAQNDPSLCVDPSKNSGNSKIVSYCKAIVSGNASLCADASCRDTVYYMAAVKSGDARICDRITGSGGTRSGAKMQWSCKCATAGNASACSQAKGIDEFRKSYCAQKAKRSMEMERGIEEKARREQR